MTSRLAIFFGLTFILAFASCGNSLKRKFVTNKDALVRISESLINTSQIRESYSAGNSLYKEDFQKLLKPEDTRLLSEDLGIEFILIDKMNSVHYYDNGYGVFGLQRTLVYCQQSCNELESGVRNNVKYEKLNEHWYILERSISLAN